MEFRLAILASFTRQLAYAPRTRRLAQLEAAEDLLLKIDPELGYPVGYVVHAITGYRPKHEDAASNDAAELLTGVALQHDLGLLVERVSDEMDLSTLDPALGGEPILSINDVCERFEVTSKTIQRWRRKGLPARRFIFPDEAGNGKKRVGFRLACVERFIANQEGSAERPAGLDPLSESEQGEVVRRARQLAEAGHDRREIVRRVARRSGRSSLAILHTLEHHDRQFPDSAVLLDAAEPLTKEAAADVLDRSESGASLASIARVIGRPRSAVYRVLIEAKAEKLASAGVKYHDDPLYHADDPADAERQVSAIVSQAQEQITGKGEDAAERRQLTTPPNGVPAYLRELYRTPLLTPALERALFLQFNFHKCRFAELRRSLDPHLCRHRDLQALERHLRLARATKNQIVTANLRLVVSVARKHQRAGLDLMELVSDGNIVLMRAVEGFDIHRGFKFSTYATLALMKGYARSVPALQAQQQGTPSLVADPAAADYELARMRDRDELGCLLRRLDEDERSVLRAEWDLAGDDADELDLPRHRIRQIEKRALAKLRGFVQQGDVLSQS